jgi:hypothetical protein
MDTATFVLEENQQTPAQELQASSQDFPEGGYGWFQVFLSFMIQFFLLGMVNVFGVYQEAYRHEPIMEGY